MNFLQIKEKYIFLSLSIFVSLLYIFLSYFAIPIGSDPGRLWRLSKLFYEGEITKSFASLEPFLPVSTYGTLFAFGGYDFPMTLVQGIASALVSLLVVNYIRKNAGILTAILASLFFLASYIFLERSVNLIPYPLFLLFTTLGILTFIKYRELNEDIYLHFSSIFFVFSIFTFNLSLATLPIVFIYCLLAAISNKKSWKRELRTVIIFYSIALTLIAPWFIWRFEAAGMNFYKNPINWLMEKYWPRFNLMLWNRARPRTPEYFKFFLKSGFEFTIGPYIFILFTILGYIKSKNTVILLWLIMPLLPILMGKLPTEERYLYGIIPPAIILSSLGVNYIIKNSSFNIKAMCICAITAICIHLFIKNIEIYNTTLTTQIRSRHESELIKKVMKKDENIYTRSFLNQTQFPNNLMLSATSMQEEESINFLRWENENEVKEIIEKYEIIWVLLYKSGKKEYKFNSWLSLVESDYEPNHFIKIEESPYFEKKLTTENYILYRYKQ